MLFVHRPTFLRFTTYSIGTIRWDQNIELLNLRSPDPLESSKSVALSSFFFDFLDLLFLFGMLSFLRRLDGPAKSADVSTTVSGKGRFLDDDSSTLLDFG